jgi:response regulator RpfG family c-di-GMP phosphodiesterase
VPGSKAQQKLLAARMTDAAAADYRAVVAEAEQLASDGAASRRTVERLRRELRRIEARDHYPPEEREQARQAVERLAATLDATDEESTR